MRIHALKTVFFALAALAVFAPLAPLAAEACPMMAGNGMAMSPASAACCGSEACPCGMKSAPRETESALLPVTVLSARSEAASLQPLSDDAPKPFLGSAPAPDDSPPKSSSKERLYDLNSDYRI